MKATLVLEAEHPLIANVIKGLSYAMFRIENAQSTDLATLETAAEFLQLYADKLHHGKEEHLLFPLLVQNGLDAQGCPLGVLESEHEEGRALARALTQLAAAFSRGQTGARADLLTTLRRIVDLYQTHIRKEDQILFPVANRILGPADQAQLAIRFQAVDEAIGSATIERLERFARAFIALPEHTEQSALPHVCTDCACGD